MAYKKRTSTWMNPTENFSKSAKKVVELSSNILTWWFYLMVHDGSVHFLVLHASWQKFQMTPASNNSRPSFNPCCKVHLHVSHHLISSKSEMDGSAFGIWSYLQAEAYYKHFLPTMFVSQKCAWNTNLARCFFGYNGLEPEIQRYENPKLTVFFVLCNMVEGGMAAVCSGSVGCSMISNAFHSASVVQHANTTPRYYTHSKCR